MYVCMYVCIGNTRTFSTLSVADRVLTPSTYEPSVGQKPNEKNRGFVRLNNIDQEDNVSQIRLVRFGGVASAKSMNY